MHNHPASRLLGIGVLLIILILVTLAFGAGKFSTGALKNQETVPVAGGHFLADVVTGGNMGISTISISPTRSPTSQDLQPFNPIRTLTFLPTGTYIGAIPGTATPTPESVPTLPGEYVTDVLLVRIDPALAGIAFKECLKSANATIGAQIKEIDVLQVFVPKGDVSKAVAVVSDCPGVSYAEPDYIVTTADTIPNDPGLDNQYGLVAIRAPQGWDKNTGSTTVTIAIVDTGVDLTHADLAGKLVTGKNYITLGADPQDDNGHGTHVAGIAAAITNNSIGVAGVSWGARIMPVKVLAASGSGSIDNVALGIIWAVNNGAQVINLSLGCACETPPGTLEAAVNFAYENGATLVAAVGNGVSNFVFYPARFPHVIAVAATDSSNNHAPFSRFGPEVDVSAPGALIYSTYRNSIYSFMSGTSMSTAFVSGLAAILRGLPNYSSPDQIAGALESSALDLGTTGRDDLFGFGLIQADAAITDFQATPTPTSTPTLTPTPTLHVNSSAALVLPATGFSPQRSTILPAQPVPKEFADLGDLWLEIPRLQVKLPIVGVPLVDNAWDVSWLGNQAGWLNGTAFPTFAGNSVISAHVYDASGNPGPFVHLDSLVWGDQVIVHAFGQEYVYSVRESVLAAPGAVSSVISHEEYPWLTLITCQGYDAVTNSYRSRVVVRAVQVEIK